MRKVFLTKIIIKNFGPIQDDEVVFKPFTYFVGRNNAGKSHYLKAIEILLATKAPSSSEIVKLQHDKSKQIVIEGHFERVFEDKVDDQFGDDRKLWEQLRNNAELNKYIERKMFKYVADKILALREE